MELLRRIQRHAAAGWRASFTRWDCGKRQLPLTPEEGITEFKRRGWRVSPERHRELVEADEEREQGYGEPRDRGRGAHAPLPERGRRAGGGGPDRQAGRVPRRPRPERVGEDHAGQALQRATGANRGHGPGGGGGDGEAGVAPARPDGSDTSSRTRTTRSSRTPSSTRWPSARRSGAWKRTRSRSGSTRRSPLWGWRGAGTKTRSG